jgi:hypothetical protein
MDLVSLQKELTNGGKVSPLKTLLGIKDMSPEFISSMYYGMKSNIDPDELLKASIVLNNVEMMSIALRKNANANVYIQHNEYPTHCLIYCIDMNMVDALYILISFGSDSNRPMVDMVEIEENGENVSDILRTDRTLIDPVFKYKGFSKNFGTPSRLSLLLSNSNKPKVKSQDAIMKYHINEKFSGFKINNNSFIRAANNLNYDIFCKLIKQGYVPNKKFFNQIMEKANGYMVRRMTYSIQILLEMLVCMTEHGIDLDDPTMIKMWSSEKHDTIVENMSITYWKRRSKTSGYPTHKLKLIALNNDIDPRLDQDEICRMLTNNEKSGSISKVIVREEGEKWDIGYLQYNSVIESGINPHTKNKIDEGTMETIKKNRDIVFSANII